MLTGNLLNIVKSVCQQFAMNFRSKSWLESLKSLACILLISASIFQLLKLDCVLNYHQTSLHKSCKLGKVFILVMVWVILMLLILWSVKKQFFCLKITSNGLTDSVTVTFSFLFFFVIYYSCFVVEYHRRCIYLSFIHLVLSLLNIIFSAYLLIWDCFVCLCCWE